MRPDRDVKALVIGAVVIGLLVFLSKGLPFMKHALVTRSAAAVQSAHRKEIQRILAAVAPRVLVTVRETEEDYRRVERRLLPGATPAEAAASLALLIDRYAADANVRVSSTSARADTVFLSAHPRITVRAFATADVRGLTTLLAMIEESAFLLGISELTVTQPEPAAEDDMPESLRLEFVVEALARQGTALMGTQ